MVHDYKLDKIFQIVETLHKRGKMMRLILIGDPFQLPPVVAKNMRQAYSEMRNMPLNTSDFYFFKSGLFKKYFGDLDRYLLTRSFRQSDGGFAGVLRKIAAGLADECDIDFINQRVVNPPPLNTTVITPSRNGAKYFNRLGLEKLGERYSQTAFFERVLPEYQDIASEHQDLVEPLFYALNAPVVFTRNDIHGRWVNGTRGRINARHLDPFRNTTLEITTDRNEVVHCEPTRYNLQRFVFNRQTGSVDNECVVTVKQFPFTLGFALTVHKCQGMTLNEMAFNPGEGCFAPGQLYVALSRVKDLNGLTLHVSVQPNDIIVSDEVKRYFDYFYGKCVTIV
jgi:ATP-dependent exoDNAse (exonuclease V) alpha subunit